MSEIKTLKDTHIAIEVIDSKLVLETSTTFDGIKEASDYVEGIINDNPNKQFKIFQIRSIMAGKITIQREDFNS